MFWQNAKRTLSTMKFVKPDGTTFVPPSVQNFKQTIINFTNLYQYMRILGFDCLVPRTFNQDSLENFFGRIRQRGVCYTNPTCSAFTPFYKSLLVKGFTSGHSLGANCEDDQSDIFLTLHSFSTQNLSSADSDEGQEIIVPNLLISLKPFEEHAIKYVCG